MKTLRVFFSKTDRAKYISHLDLARSLTRAFARTDIPVWFTQGFNPHFYLTFALPLPLGFTSREESLDFRVLEDDYPEDLVAAQLATVFPPDIQVLRVAPPVDDPRAITWADYDIRLTPEGCTPGEMAKALEEFLAQPEILAQKKTKHRTTAVDLRPQVLEAALEPGEEDLHLTLRLAAGSTLNLNPNLLLDTFCAHAGLEIAYRQVERTAVRKADLSLFA